MATDKTLSLNKGAPEPPPGGAPVPEEDSRSRAEQRARELEAHWGGTDLPPDMDTSDKFYFDRRIIPDGWDYQWWPFEVLGKGDSAFWTDVESGGWTAVPRTRHPEMMPDGWGTNTIERGGQRLMEQPMIITQRVKARDFQKARDQVGDKEAQLHGTPPGTLERAKSTGESLVRVNRSRESIAVPK